MLGAGRASPSLYAADPRIDRLTPRGRQWMLTSVPPINDVTTDTHDPPRFVAVLPLRKGARTSSDYGGQAVAILQRAAWPDIVPIDTPVRRSQVHAAVRAVVAGRGWALVGDDEGAGRIEAIATTRWLRFKDDIVVRLRDLPGAGTRVDIRSKSRVGRSDLGTNARRIRTFVADLQRTLETQR